MSVIVCVGVLEQLLGNWFSLFTCEFTGSNSGPKNLAVSTFTHGAVSLDIFLLSYRKGLVVNNMQDSGEVA